jgi:serine/threonine protein kinase
MLGHVLARSDKSEGFAVRSVRKIDGTSEDVDCCCLAAKCSNELRTTGCLSESLKKEYEILKGLKHPSIVMAKHLVQAEVGCAMVMELCIGECLDRFFVASIEAGSKRFIIDQVLGATAYLHQEKVAHRDLHSGNIIVNPTDLAVKVVDFNCACREEGPVKTWCTSSCNEDQPLEVYDLNLSILPAVNKDGVWDMFSLDIFAIGLLTLGLMTAQTVVTSDLSEGAMLKSPSGVELSGNSEAYVRSLLTYQATDRPSAAMARETLPNMEEWPSMPVFQVD